MSPVSKGCPAQEPGPSQKGLLGTTVDTFPMADGFVWSPEGRVSRAPHGAVPSS